MDKRECATAGAMIERGTVAEVTAGGCRVRSLDRPGLVSCVITGTDNTAYTTGETVYFFLFRDGTGKILCKA